MMDKSLRERVRADRQRYQNQWAHIDYLDEFESQDRKRLMGNPYASIGEEDSAENLIDPIASIASGKKDIRHQNYVVIRNSDIEFAAKELQKLIWKNRKSIWGDRIPVDPINLLDPEVALKFGS